MMRLNHFCLLLSGVVACAADPVETTDSFADGSTGEPSMTTTAANDDDDTTGAADEGVAESEADGTPTAEPMCGNDIIDGADVCDGTDVAGETCASLGFEQGELGCTMNCGGFDLTGCGFFECGDGRAQGDEDCDGTVGAATCASEGFDNGTLFCTTKCEYDTSQCGTCGNRIIDPAEECDIKSQLEDSCFSLGFMTGQLQCGDDCQYNSDGCSTCGNDLQEGNEDCDGTDVPGKTCVGEGFDSGTLSCQANCQYDFTACGTCGNGLRDGDELCDAPDFGADSCITEGFDSGDLTCNATCDTVTTDSCGVCGNGATDGAEDCDDVGESATCDADCTSVVCGDGVTNVSAGEECDGGPGCDIMTCLNCPGGVCPLYWQSGVQTNVPEDALSGWTECWSSTYNTNIPNLTAQLLGVECTGELLLEACRPVGSTDFTVLAMANRVDVLFDVGNGANAVHDANGVSWYYNNSYSMGFAGLGDGVQRNSCDVANINPENRLCWHTGGDAITGGYRCGATTGLNGSVAWERMLFHAN